MQHRPSTTNRACEECKRKKTKCDGNKPQCSLCMRVRASCVYPHRKSRTQPRSRWRSDASSDSNSPIPAAAAAAAAQQNVDYENLGWRDLIDHYYYAPDPMNAASSGLLDQVSPGDQDMIDYLTETVPSIWMPETIPHLSNQLNSLPESILPGQSSETAVLSSTSGESDSSDVKNNCYKNQIVSSSSRLPISDMQQIELSHEYSLLSIPEFVIDDLIALYFQRIQVFLPLFRQPTFHQTYLQMSGQNKYANLRNEYVFVLYGMMALSARFSCLPYFEDTSIRERGNQFARKAQMIYHEILLGSKQPESSLIWLQGFILLAYFNQSSPSSKPTLDCDLLISACIRMAYDLGLHKIDEAEQSPQDKHSPASAPEDEEWVAKEEQRRAWWAVWELDAFDSISSRRPFKVDRHRILVFLPVSDEAWFAGKVVKSAMPKSDILQCWKILRDSPNQDERAWFLISNYIAVQALELCQQRYIAQKVINEVETVVSCFSHLFYEKFRSRCDQLTFDEISYAKSNWLILTRLMVQSTRIITCILNRRASSDPLLTVSNRFFNTEKRHQRAIPSTPVTDAENWYEPAGEVLRIYQSWSPEFIGFVPPTMVSMITGPAAIVLRCARHLRKEQNGGDLSKPSIQEDLLILILSHFARYWDIGRLLLDFVRAFQ